MQVDFLDRFSRGASPVHRCDARVKLVLALVTVAMIIATPELVALVFAESWASWFFYGVEAWLVLAVYALSRLPWRYLIVRLLAVLPFLALVALGIPLTHAFERGWHDAAQLLARSLLSLAVMVTLVATTPFSRLLVALQRLGVPQALISILAFMYRYMFVLVDELGKMRRARLARSFYPSIWWETRLMAQFVGILFVRAFERAERVHAAMCARGWHGGLPRQDGTR